MKPWFWYENIRFCPFPRRFNDLCPLNQEIPASFQTCFINAFQSDEKVFIYKCGSLLYICASSTWCIERRPSVSPSTQRHEASSNDVKVTSLTPSPTLEECTTECTLRPPHLRCIVPRGCISNCWNSASMMHVWLCRLYGAHSHRQGGWFITTATNDLGCPTQSQWLSGERLILPLTHTHTLLFG